MKVSVVQSVYAGDQLEPFRRSVESILNQSRTFFDEIEYLIAVDGPVSESLVSYLEHLKFSSAANVSVFYLEENKGLAFALNILLHRCTGELIFRMDSDDFSCPDRFDTQIDYLTINKLDACGSAILFEGPAYNFSVAKPKLFSGAPGSFPSEMPFHHATICVKRELVTSGTFTYEPYLTGARAFEDLYLWLSFFRFGGSFGNCEQDLYKVTLDASVLQRRAKLRQIWNLSIAKYEISRALDRGIISSILHGASAFRRLSYYILPLSFTQKLIAVFRSKN